MVQLAGMQATRGGTSKFYEDRLFLILATISPLQFVS